MNEQRQRAVLALSVWNEPHRFPMLTEADLIELRLLRERLRQEALRLPWQDRSRIVEHALATDSTRQAERWLAVIERILKDA